MNKLFNFYDFLFYFIGVGLHAKIIDMVGPKWFQELSPNQIKCIEQLEISMKKDLKQQTTSNTVEIIDYLGLNPRPNERKFRSALKQSAGSPVEFLLALYYQIRKNETTYTINDRLLLSSVVHLTMTNTLREMHIRSPSPPPSPKPQPPVERTPKSKTYYESPYLIPFNFQPEPKKFTGIYKNKHLQYPESDYFNYIPQLKSDMFLGNVFEDNPESWKLEEREIIEEMLIAQQLYNRFCENTVKLKLLKASTWKDYSLFESPQMQYDDFCEIEEEFEENDSTKPKLNNIFEDESSLDLVPSISISSNSKNNLEELKFAQLPCNSNCKMQLESLLTGKCPNWEQIKRKQFNCTINSGVVIRQDEKIPIIQGIKDNSCSCIENYKRTIADYEYKNEIKRQQNVLKTSALATYCINGVCVTKNGPIYVTNAIKPKFQLNQLENSLNQVKTMQNNMLEYEINKKIYYEEENELKTRLELIKARRERLEKILPGKCLANNKKECDCVETYLNHLNLVEHNTRLQEAVNYIKTQKVKFTIGGVTYRSNSPVFIINGVSPIVNKRKYNECIKYLEEFKDMLLKKEPDFKYEGEKTCPECIGIVEQYLNQMTKTTVIKLPERPKTPQEVFEPICKCKEETEKKLEDLCKCSAFQANKHPTLIKSGIKLTQSGTEINILDRVYDKACTCLPEYKDKMGKFELYKKRIEARLKLMNEKEKFVISGVCQTPKGPVYNISNVLTPGYCCCSEFADEEEARERHRQAMPKAPIQDGVKFSICGVRETPEGNVYILDNAIQQDACICMRLFEQFQNEHSFCTKTYKRFEENLKQSLQKYYSEAENEKMQTKEEDNVKEPKEIVLSTSSSRISSCNCHVPLSKHENSKDSCTCDENFTEVTDVLNNSPKNNEDSVVSVKNMEDLSSEKEPVKSLKSEKVTESLISIKSKSELIDEQNEATKSFTLGSTNLKRYLILRKFPCKKKKQMAILKKLLNSLAEDGYPLAKLPDSYKLPHFKLWLDLRCGKFWTQADRSTFLHCKFPFYFCVLFFQNYLMRKV